jgi:hypothetical protein
MVKMHRGQVNTSGFNPIRFLPRPTRPPLPPPHKLKTTTLLFGTRLDAGGLRIGFKLADSDFGFVYLQTA